MLEQLWRTLESYTTTDFIVGAVDVFLVAFVIYRVLLLIRGTKAVQMLVGVMLIMIFYLLSKDEYLGLKTLNWLLDKFIASFILILVIVFQDEIRRGLSQVGSTGGAAFTGLSQLEQTHFLEEIIKASFTLAEKRTGALIVIEREASLDEYMAEGIPLDAAVSHQLLNAIFVPERSNPTHDGAAVITKGRIAAAGCFLPLTTSPRVEKMLGTRHRAALGLTELTDAVVIVVSEETGIVSLAFQGELVRRLETSDLRELLQKLFSEDRVDSISDKPRSLLAKIRQRGNSKRKASSEG